MHDLRTGMNVMVDIAGFGKDGVSIGSGAITAINGDEITVQLFGTVAGINVVTVPSSRVSVA
jgi:hypothetical protein